MYVIRYYQSPKSTVVKLSYLYVSKLANHSQGQPKGSFSIDITLRYRGEPYSFPWIVPLTLDLYIIILSVNQGHIKYHFWVFGMAQPEIEPWSFAPSADTNNCVSVQK